MTAAPAAKAPLVTVITPFFDAGRWLDEAIESVLAQTLPSFELLLVDDGSSDCGTEIARAHAARDPDRVRYLEHPQHRNLGKAVSRNAGIAEARGEYVTFLDADDVFLPQKLERQVAILDRHPDAVLVYGATEYWWSWSHDGGRRPRDRRSKIGVPTERLYAPPELLVAYLRDPGIVPCICGLLARTSVVRDTGAFDEAIQNLYEDQVLIAKLLLAGPVYVESGCSERYRQHPDASSLRAIESGDYHPVRSNPARREYLEWLGDYVRSGRVNSTPLERALRAAYRPYRYPRLYRLVDPLKAAYYGLRYGS
jgi:glycosyltransferase involved in cell wall biosynthesis